VLSNFSRTRGRLSRPLQNPAFALIGPLEEEGEHESDDAETGEHQQAAGVRFRPIAEEAVDQGEDGHSDILDGGHQTKGRSDPLFFHHQRNGGPQGRRNEDKGRPKGHHRISRVDPGQAHGQMARDQDQRAEDHQRRPLSDLIHQLPGERSKNHRGENDDRGNPARGAEHMKKILEDLGQKSARALGDPGDAPFIDGKMAA
jgi:hypothetical protein